MRLKIAKAVTALQKRLHNPKSPVQLQSPAVSSPQEVLQQIERVVFNEIKQLAINGVTRTYCKELTEVALCELTTCQVIAQRHREQ